MPVKRKNNGTPSIISIIRNYEKYMNDRIAIANTFNKSFPLVAENVQSKIKFPNKSFRNFLSTKNNDSFIINNTNKEELCKIILSLNINKSCGPNSIPTKILRAVEDQISKHLATIRNFSFSAGTFPTILRTAKLVPKILNENCPTSELFFCYPVSIKFSKN